MMLFSVPQVGAEEKIIQQEKISFEKCIKIITVSQDKLSMLQRLRMFRIKSVRRLRTCRQHPKITCDGIDGKVEVSTNTN